jgi:hypothetical protein
MLGSLHMEFKGYHADPLHQLRANNPINSRGELGCVYGFSGNGVGHCFSRICGHRAPAHTRCHFCLVNLVPAVAFAPPNATLVRVTFLLVT